MKKPLDIFTFLKGKKPDWYPAQVKMNKDGSISMMSLRDHTFEGYWEILLIGFNDAKKQREWMHVYSEWLKYHHKMMLKQGYEDRMNDLDSIIDRASFLKSIYIDSLERDGLL